MNEYYSFDDRNMRGTFRDWRKALRTPATYRVGNAVRVQPQFILLIVLIGIFLIVLCYYNWWTSTQVVSVRGWERIQRPYNSTYPLTHPLVGRDAVKYRIGIIADLDKDSKSSTKSNTYISYFKKGYLSYNPVQQSVSIEWDPKPPTVLTSTYSHKGRGMELSELIVYDGRLLTFDDRSGLVSIIFC